MTIVQTTCTPEQQKADMPELQKAYDKAKEENPLWGFFGGTIKLSNGHVYQVAQESIND